MANASSAGLEWRAVRTHEPDSDCVLPYPVSVRSETAVIKERHGLEAGRLRMGASLLKRSGFGGIPDPDADAFRERTYDIFLNLFMSRGGRRRVEASFDIRRNAAQRRRRIEGILARDDRGATGAPRLRAPAR